MGYRLLDEPAAPALPPKGKFVLMDDSAEQAPKPRSALDTAGRQVGLTARAAAQGVGDTLALPATIYDAAADAFGSKDGFRFNSSKAVSKLLDRFLPSPETAPERISQDVAGAMAGGMTMMKAGDLISRFGTEYAMPAMRKVGDLLGADKARQLVAATGGSGAGSVAKESGASPGVVLAANLVGGTVSPMAVEGAKAGGRAVIAAKDLITDGGRRNVVGNIMRDAVGKPNVLGVLEDSMEGRTSVGGGGMSAAAARPEAGGTLAGFVRDPAQVVKNLENVPTLVKGSQPTTAQAAKSAELAILERGLQSSNPRFAAALDEREALNNAARQTELRRMGGGETGVADAISKRSEVTAPMRTAALDQANIVGVSTDKLMRQIRGVESQPGIRASDVVSKSLAEVKDKIASFTDKDGFINSKDLYTLRKELGSLITKNADANKNWDKRLTGGLQNQVQSYMDDAIEAAGGQGWKDYLKRYSTMSKPVEQMQTIEGIRKGSENARVMSLSGSNAEYGLSQAKFKSLFTDRQGELSQTLSAQQMAKMKNVADDLDRGSLSVTQGRSIGSNTMQNLSTAYILGSVLGSQGAGQVSNKLAAPLRWLTTLHSRDVEDLLGRAMLNPELARSLMAKATPRTIESISFELQQTAKAAGLGTVASSALGAGQ